MTLAERLAILDGRSNSNESWMEGSIAGDEYVAIAREAVAALNEVEGAFAMQTDAIQRAAAAWREKTGEELVSPDTTRLVYWLLWDREDYREVLGEVSKELEQVTDQLAERDELLDRAAGMFRAMRYRIKLADGKPLDQWLADYESQIADTSSRVSTDRDEEKTCVWTWSDVDETGREDGACVTTSCGHRVEPAPGLQIRCHICGGVIEITDCDDKEEA